MSKGGYVIYYYNHESLGSRTTYNDIFDTYIT